MLPEVSHRSHFVDGSVGEAAMADQLCDVFCFIEPVTVCILANAIITDLVLGLLPKDARAIAGLQRISGFRPSKKKELGDYVPTRLQHN